ncbi:MAG TPA: class I SAM-dependent methyltransferase [Mycobacterium sp.]|nr:class I SAM-dependent methyltransferase [Mycobacterium sp.]
MSPRAELGQAHFDRWAFTYDRSPLQPILFRPTHAAVISAARDAGVRPQDVLDVGCGTGALLERAASTWPNAHLVGIDASEQMAAKARSKHAGDSRYRFEVADAAALPLPDGSVDLALSTISFHHWSDQAGGVREVARVLRASGVFVLADIRPPWLLRPVMGRFYAEQSRRRLLDAAGYTVIEQRRPLRLGGHVLISVSRR